MKKAIEEIESPRQLSVLTYPKRDPKAARSRLQMLRELGVTHLEFVGPTEVKGVRILGKGTTSMVFKVYVENRPAAVKILRMDANRDSVRPEAERIKMANEVGVGPKLIAYSDAMLLMEFIDGERITAVLARIVDFPSRERARRLRDLVREILVQCFRLDDIGLDHGQLFRPDRHIYVTSRDRVKIIDFETSSTSRRSSNLTSILQFLLVSGPYAELIRKVLNLESLEEFFPVLRRYKKNPDEETFNCTLRLLNIETA
ncbi:MAG: hypothetical protein GTN80_09565 [Nitrososphaeria archaeon]|nr:hypothetical protein [Nitrososphaeria archaeon]NIN53103.1 hypothetical protein [Nitrososphaeria archaeon]NIQ33869.1 hypothetical protein [Nitrososphaeria archaeon]